MAFINAYNFVVYVRLRIGDGADYLHHTLYNVNNSDRLILFRCVAFDLIPYDSYLFVVISVPKPIFWDFTFIRNATCCLNV